MNFNWWVQPSNRSYFDRKKNYAQIHKPGVALERTSGLSQYQICTASASKCSSHWRWYRCRRSWGCAPTPACAQRRGKRHVTVRGRRRGAGARTSARGGRCGRMGGQAREVSGEPTSGGQASDGWTDRHNSSWWRIYTWIHVSSSNKGMTCKKEGCRSTGHGGVEAASRDG
jgi:hypothetical protein